VYKIGEIAESLNVNSSVLRFWETKFPQIVPERSRKGQRVYTEEQFSLLKRVRDLLYDKGMTIEGAKKALEGEGSYMEFPRAGFPSDIELELAEICRLLAADEE
ncbi:MAG: MerR family transcriptional regulator, partial [Desulfovibrio sp.]|nr:MerR family transcriptional regulator [Desulfovibrio sp.]